MEDILYTNSVTDVRVREMVTETEQQKPDTIPVHNDETLPPPKVVPGSGSGINLT